MEVRKEITVLPADDPKKKRLGWKIYEIPFDKTAREHFREVMSPEDFAEWEKSVDPKQNQETDKADLYRVYHHRNFPKNKSYGGTTIKVLDFLWGQPWNNLALNFVSALRPSCLRVATDGVTCDSVAWRVTVWVDADGIIKKIEQEVSISTEGARNAHDLELQLKYQEEHGSLERYEYPESKGLIVINDTAISNITVTEDKDD